MSQPANVISSSNSSPDSAVVSECWSCSASLGESELFCPLCGRVQPLHAKVNYFEVFGLPRKLAIDTAALERDFYRLSRKLHPDVAARASVQEQEWSLANSSLVNDAYRTLKDPVKRTEYLLEIEGVAGSDKDGKKEERVPPDLLEEVFELNMQLDEMRMNRQMGESDPQLEKDLQTAKTKFDAQFAGTDEALAKLWAKWDAAIESGDEAARQSAKQEITALLDRRRYVRNLVNSVNESLGL
jgi:molecular chaperone HscB